MKQYVNNVDNNTIGIIIDVFNVHYYVIDVMVYIKVVRVAVVIKYMVNYIVMEYVWSILMLRLVLK